MPLDRKVGFFEGLRYKGGLPMLSWLLHRIAGIGMIVFVGLHVVAGYLSYQLKFDFGDTINVVYENGWFQLFIVFSVLFHALNGMRIIILDLWPKMVEYQRELTWLQWLIFIPTYGLTVLIMIQHMLLAE